MTDKKRQPLKIGDKVYIRNVGPGHRLMWYPNHVRGFVDDNIILRWWSLRRQCWMYVIESVSSAEYCREHSIWLDKKPSEEAK